MTEEQLKEINDDKGFFKHNSFHIIEANKDSVIVKVDISENSLNPYGMVHGGIIFSLGDIAMGLLAFLAGGPSVTINASINYLKPGKGKFLKGKAELIKNGSHICCLRSYIYDENENLISTMDGAYFFTDKK